MKLNFNNKEKTLKLLDTYLFFENGNWYFVDDSEFMVNDDDCIDIDVNNLINIGLELANNLNKMNIDVSDYDCDKIEEYLK